MEEQNSVGLQQGIQTLRIIWAAMIGSLGIYLIIVHFIGKEIQFGEMPKATYDMMRYALMGLGVVILFLAQYVRKLILKGGLGTTTSNSISPAHGSALGRYTAAVIISLAMSESVGIFGLLLFFLGRDFQTFYLFLAFSAIAMVVYRPKMEELESLSEPTGQEGNM
ncbi:MAG: hypothetical protein ABII26_12455 [Pseudomonadota bacterium]